GTATFTVRARGARAYQWVVDGVAIPGATGSSYTTAPVTAPDTGKTFSVTVTGNCPTAVATSDEVRVLLEDETPPTSEVTSPTGGEYWLLSPEEGPPRTQQITWTMSDDVRICRVQVRLNYYKE